MGGGFILSLCLVQAVVDSAPAQDRTVPAVVGGDVTLPCKADRNQSLEVVEWSKPGTDTELVLIFKTKNPDLEVPKKSYEGRVELKDRENGDMSLVLRNVRAEDGGTYECYVLGERSRRKRAELQPISTVHLHVAPPPGRGHLGVSVGVVLVVLAAGAAAFVWKMKKKN